MLRGNRRARHCAALLALCGMACVARAAGDDVLARCDEHRSALARSVINKYIKPNIYWSGHVMEKSCPLHPDRDMGAEHEVLGLGKDVCLADLCEPLLCDRLAEPASEAERQALKPLPPDGVCNEAETANLRAKCKRIAETCFLNNVKSKDFSRWMWDVLYSSICRAHHCDAEWREEVLAGLRSSKPWLEWFYKIMAGYVTFILVGIYVVVWAYFRFFVGLTDGLMPRAPQQGQPQRPAGWWPFGKPKQN